MQDNSRQNREIPAGPALLGRVINFAGEPLDGLGALGNTGRIIINAASGTAAEISPKPEFFETGLKAVDLLAPLTNGGITGLFTEPGTGKQVVVGEILYNLSRHSDAIMIFAGLEERSLSLNDTLNIWKELGVSNRTVAVLGKAQNEARQVVLTALNLAEFFRDQANRTVILYVDSQLAESGHLAAYKKRLKQATNGSLLTFLGEPSNPEPGTSSAGLALDNWLTFDPALSGQGIFPAMHSQLSGSKLLKPGTVDQARLETTLKVRDLLARYSGLIQNPPANLQAADLETQARGRRLQLFLSQPLFVAESFTGLPGEYVKIEDTLKGCQAILEGKFDSLPEKAFFYIGINDDIIEKAARLK